MRSDLLTRWLTPMERRMRFRMLRANMRRFRSHPPRRLLKARSTPIRTLTATVTRTQMPMVTSRLKRKQKERGLLIQRRSAMPMRSDLRWHSLMLTEKLTPIRSLTAKRSR